MAPQEPVGPPCPKCYSPLTERLRCGQGVRASPVYSCADCGHIWEQAVPDESGLITQCPHCTSKQIKSLPPTKPDSQLTWYYCTGCGRFLSTPQTAALPLH